MRKPRFHFSVRSTSSILFSSRIEKFLDLLHSLFPSLNFEEGGTKIQLIRQWNRLKYIANLWKIKIQKSKTIYSHLTGWNKMRARSQSCTRRARNCLNRAR